MSTADEHLARHRSMIDRTGVVTVRKDAEPQDITGNPGITAIPNYTEPTGGGGGGSKVSSEPSPSKSASGSAAATIGGSSSSPGAGTEGRGMGMQHFSGNYTTGATEGIAGSGSGQAASQAGTGGQMEAGAYERDDSFIKGTTIHPHK